MEEGRRKEARRQEDKKARRQSDPSLSTQDKYL